eukprot:460146_1
MQHTSFIIHYHPQYVVQSKLSLGYTFQMQLDLEQMDEEWHVGAWEDWIQIIRMYYKANTMIRKKLRVQSKLLWNVPFTTCKYNNIKVVSKIPCTQHRQI